jgi:hypothetical protein
VGMRNSINCRLQCREDHSDDHLNAQLESLLHPVLCTPFMYDSAQLHSLMVLPSTIYYMQAD